MIDMEDLTARLAAWPPSNYPIVVAVCLLVATTFALFVAAERLANRLATYAYYALVIGILLRLAEQTAVDRLCTLLAALTGRTVLPSTAIARVRHGVTPTRDWRSIAHRGRTVLARHVDPQVRSGLWLAAVLTTLSGFALTVWWWQDPSVVVPARFLTLWLLSIVGLAGIAVLTTWVDADRRG